MTAGAGNAATGHASPSPAIMHELQDKARRWIAMNTKRYSTAKRFGGLVSHAKEDMPPEHLRYVLLACSLAS
jgi:hypothetical protein